MLNLHSAECFLLYVVLNSLWLREPNLDKSKNQTTNDLHYWLHLKKKVLHPITVIMLTNKSVVVLTGLKKPPGPLCPRPRQVRVKMVTETKTETRACERSTSGMNHAHSSWSLYNVLINSSVILCLFWFSKSMLKSPQINITFWLVFEKCSSIQSLKKIHVWTWSSVYTSHNDIFLSFQ